MVPHQGTAGRYIMAAVKGKGTTPECSRPGAMGCGRDWRDFWTAILFGPGRKAALPLAVRGRLDKVDAQRGMGHAN
jgi:hypothetical protein